MKATHFIQGITFEWDADKAVTNLVKHGISFEAACEAFFDPFLTPLEDDMVDGEVRHTAIGMTADWQFLFLVYVWRGDTIRLISARRAARYQRKSYENR